VTVGEIGAWEHHDNDDVTDAVQRWYCSIDEQIVSTIRVTMVRHVHAQEVREDALVAAGSVYSRVYATELASGRVRQRR
jgi:hypothetical protein